MNIRKNSRQQAIIANAVLDRADHPTAEMVLATAHEADPKISLATVYRNLERMISDGQIMKITMSEGPDRFEPSLTEHIHAVCDDCGEIFDVPSGLPRRAQKCVGGRINFTPCGCEITVHGKCECCNRNKGKEAV